MSTYARLSQERTLEVLKAPAAKRGSKKVNLYIEDGDLYTIQVGNRVVAHSCVGTREEAENAAKKIADKHNLPLKIFTG